MEVDLIFFSFTNKSYTKIMLYVSRYIVQGLKEVFYVKNSHCLG
jgi:hypothetical protein